MDQLDPMNRLAEKYKDRISFLFIYAREAHPRSPALMVSEEEDISAVTPKTANEVYAGRQSAGRLLRTRLAENWHVLIDGYGQRGARLSFMRGLGNPLFVVDKDGKVATRMEWTDAQELDQFLSTFLSNQRSSPKS
jgi:hypothetical protein